MDRNGFFIVCLFVLKGGREIQLLWDLTEQYWSFFSVCHYCKVFLTNKPASSKYLSVSGVISLTVVFCVCFVNIRSAQWVRLPTWTQTSLAMKSGKSFPWVLPLRWRKWWSLPSASLVSEISPNMTRLIFWRLGPLRWDHCVYVADLTSCASVWPPIEHKNK